MKVLTLNLEENSARRIALRGIAMESDDMFVGHCVTAYGTLADGVTAANMEGRVPRASAGVVYERCGYARGSASASSRNRLKRPGGAVCLCEEAL